MGLSSYGWQRIGRQLGVTVEFLAPHISKVTLPGGIPYEAFDSSGTKVTPWSLMRLFESSRATTFWRRKSFADFYRILQDNNFFIVSAKLEVDKALYTESTPKYPLSITTKLTYIGNSAFCNTSHLIHPEVTVPMATCQIQTVLVGRQTRKPNPFPDWWREKYADTCSEGKPLFVEKIQKPPRTVKCDIPVMVSDTDTYYHVNWTSYGRFYCDAASEGVMLSRYGKLVPAHLDSGLRSLLISYKKECNAGDHLTVESWEDPDHEHTLNFDLNKNGETCSQASIKFYTPTESAQL